MKYQIVIMTPLIATIDAVSLDHAATIGKIRAERLRPQPVGEQCWVSRLAGVYAVGDAEPTEPERKQA